MKQLVIFGLSMATRPVYCCHMLVESLHIYPIKSCRGLTLERFDVTEGPLADDRRFMLINPKGHLVSQREQPRMALIEVSITGDTLELSARGAKQARFDTRTDGEARDVELWQTPCKVVDQGQDVADWLTAYLGSPVRLVAQHRDYARPLHPALPRQFDGRTTFADAAPFLVVTQASLDDLNRRLETPVPMNRFRPNVVISGASSAYAEDDWKRIRIGDVELVRLIQCGRCVMTTTDQETAERGKEPLRTLATYRPKTPLGVPFGTYYAHAGPGQMKVGDGVEVIERS